MGITAKSKTKTTDNWPGMGFLLIFFPAEDDQPTTTTTTTTNLATLKRTNSHSNPILTKAQSTISICVLFLFLTLLLFTLSTFEPTTTASAFPPRRFLSYKKQPPNITKPTSFWFLKTKSYNKPNQLPLFALQGMGKLHMRGTRAMADLFVCHVSEETNEDDFKLFLRLLFRSGLISRADVVFLFPSSSFSIKFDPLITQEIDSFLRLLDYYYYYYYYKEKTTNSTSLLGFDVARFLRKKDGGDPLWGKKVRAVNHIIINNNNNSGIGLNESEGSNFTESTRPSYGSVVSFEASELDPENSLSGFLDHVPISLRRWACYPMLLGRVKRNFKHVMLVDVMRSFFFMGDPLARARNQSPELVYVFGKHDGRTTTTTTTSRRNSEKTKSRGRVDSAVLMGGARGVRRLSSSMLIEIARVAMRQQHKRRNSVTELGVLGQLVENEHVLKNIDLVESAESLPDLSSLVGLTSNSNSSSREFHNQWSIIQRGNGNNNIRELNSIIMKRICECEIDSSVYRDC